jgi:L-fuconolactonase
MKVHDRDRQHGSASRSIIDAHHHFWGATRQQYPGMIGELAKLRRAFSPSDLQPHLVETGVVGTILVETRSDLYETRELMATADAHAFICGVVGWVDLTDPRVADTLAELRGSPGGDKLVGIRHQLQHERDAEWLRRPDVVRGLQEVARANLVYDLLVGTRELPAAIEVVREVSETRFVVEHLAKPPRSSGDLSGWASALRRLARSDNVVAKLSGVATLAEWNRWNAGGLQPAVDVALAAFGADRLMFGSDWPVCLLSASYEQVVEAAHKLTASLSEAERSRVFGENAISVYGLRA